MFISIWKLARKSIHCVALVLILTAPQLAKADTVRIARTGDTLSDGATIVELYLPVLNQIGDVLFQARIDLDEDGLPDEHVIIKADGPGSFTEIARTGDTLGNGATLTAFRTNGGISTTHFFSDNGRAGFMANMSIGGAVICSGLGGSLHEFKHDGDPVPGATQGEVVKDLSLLGYTDDGDYVYLFKPFTPPGSTGWNEIWRNAARLAWQGKEYGSTIVSQCNARAVSETGDILISATVVGSPSYTAWLRPFEGNLNLVLDETATTSNGGTFNLDVGAGGQYYNRTLTVGFGAYLDGVPMTEDNGTFIGGGMSPAVIAIEGDESPTGGPFAGLYELDLNDSNQMLLGTWIKPDGDPSGYDALFRSSAGGLLTTIAVEGDADPLGTGTLAGFDEGALNAHGHAAFLGPVRVGTLNRKAVFIWDGQDLTTIAQEAELFDGQELTMVNFVGRAGNAINRSAFNDAGDVAFLAEGAIMKAIYVYDSGTSVAAPPATVLPVARWESASPNPFNPQTTLTYSLETATHVTIEVFDTAGRRVRTLLAEDVMAGTHRVHWNGADDHGSRVGSGSYFCRLRVRDESQVIRLTLLK